MHVVKMKIKSNLKLTDLKWKLQKEVEQITLENLYDLSYHFQEENRYLPTEYKTRHMDSVQNIIIKRYKQLSNDKKDYEGTLSGSDAKVINELLLKDEDKTAHLLSVIAIYATYLLKEPIHMNGTIFPGNSAVYKRNGKYYCPVKKKHMKDDLALCRYCVAKIPEE